MRVPLANIVVPFVVITCALKELTKKLLMLGGVSHEMMRCATRSLHREIRNTKGLPIKVLTDQNATNFPVLRHSKFVSKDFSRLS